MTADEIYYEQERMMRKMMIPSDLDDHYKCGFDPETMCISASASIKAISTQTIDSVLGAMGKEYRMFEEPVQGIIDGSIAASEPFRLREAPQNVYSGICSSIDSSIFDVSKELTVSCFDKDIEMGSIKSVLDPLEIYDRSICASADIGLEKTPNSLSSICDVTKCFALSLVEDNIKKACFEFPKEDLSMNWAGIDPGMMEARAVQRPQLAIPRDFESSIDLSLLSRPVPREVTLSDETIEKLADRLAKKGKKVIVIAKDKSVAIMGNASSGIINTGDIE